MTRLVLINGAPGSGKSTLARRYVADHPLTLALELDAVRSMLGGWLEAAHDAGLITRRMALAMARVQLAGGRDVVVPQFLGRLEFVLALEELCGQVGVDFVEVALLSSPQDAADRFVQRSRDPESEAHRDAGALLDRIGGLGELGPMYDRLLEVVAIRPRTLVVTTVGGRPDRAYRDLLALLARTHE